MGGEVGVKRRQIRGLSSKRVRAFDPEVVTARGAAGPGSIPRSASAYAGEER
jgi:hypothetical protein